MKKLQTLLAIAMGGALLNAGLSASAQPTKPGYATVIRVRGETSYSLDKGVHKYPLVQGKFLEAGSTIYTGHDGEVDVILAKAVQLPQASWSPQRVGLAVDSPVRGMITYHPFIEQNTVRLMPDSALGIDKLTTVSSGADTVADTELDLQKGKIFASVKKLSAASQYLIKTPTGIAGVRGTVFTMSLKLDGSIDTVQVYETHGGRGHDGRGHDGRDHDGEGQGLVLAVTPASGGPVQTYVIEAGEMSVDGRAPEPMPPGMMADVRRLEDAVRTAYYLTGAIITDTIAVLEDITQSVVSSDIGSGNL